MRIALPCVGIRQSGLARPSVAVAALTVAGFALRLALAGSPLGGDEIWSLENLSPLRHFWGVLWGISHDNNHFGNSLWLYFVWPLSHDERLLRLPSILAGTLAIPLMARLGARAGPVASVAAAALTAASFFEVVYSIQARGYALSAVGLIGAYLALERALDKPAVRPRVLFAACAGFAVFNHFAAAPAIALYGVIALLEASRRRGLRAGIFEGLALAAPTAAAVAPTFVFLAAGYREMDGLTIGVYRSFAPHHVVSALAQLEMTTFGLDTHVATQTLFALTLGPIMLAFAVVFCVRPERRIAYATMFLAIPALVLALRVPNTHSARYFFAIAPFLLLAFSETAQRLYLFRKVAGVLLIAAPLSLDAIALERLAAGGARESWPTALQNIATSPDPRMGSPDAFNIARAMRLRNRYATEQVTLVAEADLCAARPLWYVVELWADAPEAEKLSPANCGLEYRLDHVYGDNTPWQSVWFVYRAANAAH